MCCFRDDFVNCICEIVQVNDSLCIALATPAKYVANTSSLIVSYIPITSIRFFQIDGVEG